MLRRQQPAGAHGIDLELHTADGAFTMSHVATLRTMRTDAPLITQAKFIVCDAVLDNWRRLSGAFPAAAKRPSKGRPQTPTVGAGVRQAANDAEPQVLVFEFAWFQSQPSLCLLRLPAGDAGDAVTAEPMLQVIKRGVAGCPTAISPSGQRRARKRSSANNTAMGPVWFTPHDRQVPAVATRGMAQELPFRESSGAIHRH